MNTLLHCSDYSDYFDDLGGTNLQYSSTSSQVLDLVSSPLAIHPKGAKDNFKSFARRLPLTHKKYSIKGPLFIKVKVIQTISAHENLSVDSKGSSHVEDFFALSLSSQIREKCILLY